jgi:UDP-3-O-[3-hydroxymyristoyl] N-acetylglucosamine deacetylase
MKLLALKIMNQTTIARTVSVSGVGLHTGVPVDLALKPAPANTGYIFVRTDLDNFEIPASIEYISHCSYATTLMRRGVVLSTCEHLLSALRGSGVDNCFIELNNIEIPILDGSSEEWIDLISSAGIADVDSPRHLLRILDRVDLVEGDRKMSIEPSENFVVDCVIDFAHPFINRQSFCFVMTNGSFGREIASA